MNFLEAIKAMKEGKKVKRKQWLEHHFLKTHVWCKDFVVGTEEDNFLRFEKDAFLATDWEVVQEVKPETLSDKIVPASIIEDTVCAVCMVGDVKQALKECLTRLKEGEFHRNVFKEIFGEELLK